MRIASAPTVAVTSLLWRPRPDAFMLTVVCKATFVLKPGQTASLTSPEAPANADIPWHRDSQSIGVPTDLVPFKRNVDVLLIGHAYAPQRRPVTSLLAGLSVGTFTKSILVTGDRNWEPNGTCLEPEPFNRMPLSWERAAGGASTWNPIGIPVGARIDPRSRPRIPNLLPRGFVLQNATHLIPTVGFGALAPHWPARAAYVQKWGTSWNHAKWYEGLLPQELDAAYFNAAPKDQQLREFAETTQITLDHFNPDVPRLISVIEDLRPRALITRSPGTAPQEVWLRADTMLIDVDRVTCSITWRVTIALRHPQEEGTVYVEPTRHMTAAVSVKTNAMLPFQNATTAPSAAPSTNPSSPTNPLPTNRASAPDNRRWDSPQMSMSVDEFTTLPLRNEPPSTPAPLPFRQSFPSAPPGSLAFAPPPLPPPPPRRESTSVGAFDNESTNLFTVPEKPVAPSSLPFRPPSPSQLSSRADDDEITAIHTLPVPKPSTPPTTETILPFPKAAPPPSRARVRVGKTLIPDTAPSTEPALPFRPTAQSPEDPTSARNRFAALTTSSVLPFQTPTAPGDAPTQRERMPSVPPTSAFTVATPLAPPSHPASVPVPPSVPLPTAPAPLSGSGLPFQTPPTNAPPAPRERLPSVPVIGTPFHAPLGAAAPPPPPSAPPMSTPLGVSGLPFQTPPTNAPPPPPRERLPSVPVMGSIFGAPLGAAPPPTASTLSTPIGGLGLPFQTPSTNDPPPSRERLPSVPPTGEAFSTPLQATVPIASPNVPIPNPAFDAPRPVSWSRLSGPHDDIQPTIPAAKPQGAPAPKPKSELSFERYARIKVHLWGANVSREDVLSEHGIDEIEWRIMEQHQTEALDLEVKEGKCDLALALLDAFETANKSPTLSAP